MNKINGNNHKSDNHKKQSIFKRVYKKFPFLSMLFYFGTGAGLAYLYFMLHYSDYFKRKEIIMQSEIENMKNIIASKKLAKDKELLKQEKSNTATVSTNNETTKLDDKNENKEENLLISKNSNIKNAPKTDNVEANISENKNENNKI
jgi:hypothetical protein